MNSVCPSEKCTGCSACVSKCPAAAIKLVDTLDKVYTEIDSDLCVNCNLCKQVCPTINLIEKKEPIGWFEGWSNNNSIRSISSSGGIATELISGFIKSGGYVCSCVFYNGVFDFFITNNLNEAHRFAGSKYVKSNLKSSHKCVEMLLRRGEQVLFIGLPCQVASIKQYLDKDIQDNLYCVDLICHGTPSYELLKLYLHQHGVDINKIDNIRFRSKKDSDLSFNSISYKGTVDRYLISFLNSINYTECCYDCQYASRARVSDITIGDNWGTDLTAELQKGLSLILCITEKGKSLLSSVDLSLSEVNIDKAILANGQLSRPCSIPINRKPFFTEILRGADYDKLVLKLLPKQTLKQYIKAWFIKVGLYKSKGGYGIQYKYSESPKE